MTRRIYSLVQGPPEPKLRKLRAETWQERADDWLWRHPWALFLGIGLLYGGAIFAFLWCAFKVMR